jgi:serine/threonine-protein kinase HipA
MPIGNAETFGAVTRESCFAVADALGVTKRAAERLLNELTANIEREAETLRLEFERMTIPENTRAAELRVLRNIQYVVIREMVARLRPT